MKRALIALAVAAVFGTGAAHADDVSLFGCKNLDQNVQLPAVEGKDGFFFRIAADLRMQNVVTDQAADILAHLSAALKKNGTTLIYAPIPTKGQTLAKFLPDAAKLYGFDPAVAQQVYRDQIKRLQDRGVVAVDLIQPLSSDDPANPTFFQADFHWTSQGARNAAEAIGNVIRALPEYGDVTPHQFTTVASGPGLGISTMRRTLQPYCTEALPLPKTTAYTTTEVQAPNADVNIFGDDATSGGDIALIGTSFSDAGPQNFAGFLEQYTGMPVSNFGITGGNQFGSATSYLTSKEFYDKRPKFLIWENPVYNSLAQFGAAPMDELIASAAGACVAVDKSLMTVAKDGTVDIDLSKGKLDKSSVLLADAGNETSRQVTMQFWGSAPTPLQQQIDRSDRLRGTGRFFLSFNQIPTAYLGKVDIKFDRISPADFSISLCSL